MKLRYGKKDWRKSEHQFMGRTRHIFTAYLLNRHGHMKNWPARLRAVWYAWICLYDGEICNDCGRPVARGIGTYWMADDKFWMDLVGKYSKILCPSCFADRGKEKGILIYWAPLCDEVPKPKVLDPDAILDRLAVKELDLNDVFVHEGLVCDVIQRDSDVIVGLARAEDKQYRFYNPLNQNPTGSLLWNETVDVLSHCGIALYTKFRKRTST